MDLVKAVYKRFKILTLQDGDAEIYGIVDEIGLSRAYGWYYMISAQCQNHQADSDRANCRQAAGRIALG